MVASVAVDAEQEALGVDVVSKRLRKHETMYFVHDCVFVLISFFAPDPEQELPHSCLYVAGPFRHRPNTSTPLHP